MESNHGRANVIFADAFTLLLEDVARILEIHQPLGSEIRKQIIFCITLTKCLLSIPHSIMLTHQLKHITVWIYLFIFISQTILILFLFKVLGV